MIYCIEVKSKYYNSKKRYVFYSFAEIREHAKEMLNQWDAREKSEVDFRSLKSCLVFLYENNTTIDLYKTTSEQIAHEFFCFNKKVNLKRIWH